VSHARKRVLVFLGGLVLLIGLVQWHHLPAVLDSPLGSKWSDGIITFLKNNTSSLVILFVLTLFYEFVGLERSAEENRRRDASLLDLLSATLASSSNDALIEYSLRREHDEPDSATLARLLLGEKGTKLSEFSVVVRVEASDSGYHTVMTYKYTATLPKYIVALTPNPLVVQTLSLARAVTETIVVPRDATGLAPNAAGSRVTIVGVAHGVSGTAGGSLSPLRFRTMPDRRRRALLRNAGITQEVDDCVLYEASPVVDLNTTADGKVEYVVKYRTLESLPFTFWVNDRPLHVRAIEIDLSALGRAKYERAQVHLFAGLVGWAARVKEDDGRWLFPIDSWLLAGQGVVVAWPRD
jgi:hypothetical protein